MMIVTGSIESRHDSLDEVLRLSLEHVHRSRAEPGCLRHSVHLDSENPLRLVFVEYWQDRDALLAHFAVPASAAFVRDVSALAIAAPEIEIFEAERAEL